MTYNPNIPQPTDTLSASQPQLLTNFSQLGSIFAIDHVPYTNGTVGDRGKHNKLTFTRQGVDYVANASESLFYQKDNAGVACVYYSRTAAPNFLLIGRTYPVNAAIGCSMLPGGLVIQWGIFNAPGAAESGDINFANAFAAPPYSIVTTMIRNSNSSASVYVVTGSVTAARFHVRNTDAGAHDIYWMAIGPEA